MHLSRVHCLHYTALIGAPVTNVRCTEFYNKLVELRRRTRSTLLLPYTNIHTHTHTMDMHICTERSVSPYSINNFSTAYSRCISGRLDNFSHQSGQPVSNELSSGRYLILHATRICVNIYRQIEINGRGYYSSYFIIDVQIGIRVCVCILNKRGRNAALSLLR